MENTVCKPKIKDVNNRVGYFERYLICGFFMLSFFEPYLNGAIGSLSKFYILILLIKLMINHKNLKILSFIWFYVGWLVLKIVSVMWTSNTYIPELHFFSQVGMVALLAIITSIPIDRKLLSSIVNTLWISSTVIGILSCFWSHPYHGVVYSRQVLYLFGQEADPNNQAAFLLVGLTIAIYRLLSCNKYILLSLGTIVINTYTLFITGSRGGLVSLLCIGMLLFYNFVLKGKMRSNIKTLPLIICILLALIYIINRFLPEDIFMRLFLFSSYEGGSARDIIWRNGFDLFTTDINFLLGAGWGAYYGYNFFFDAMHNTFLAMLCDVGIVGFFVFFIPIYKVCTFLIKRNQILPVAMIITGFVPSFFIDAINKRFFWVSIILAFMYYSNYKQMNISNRGTYEKDTAN